MIVSCSQCSTKFKIADDKITAAGVKVRCSKCKHTFLVTTTGPQEIDAVGQPKAQPAGPAKGGAKMPLPPPPPPPSSVLGGAQDPFAIPPPPDPTLKVNMPLPPPPSGATRGDALPPPPRPPAGGAMPLPPPPAMPLPGMKPSSAQPSSFPAVDLGPDEDVFDAPTRVGPAPDSPTKVGPPPVAKGSTHVGPPPMPPPTASLGLGDVPSALPQDMVAGIDLDADDPLTDMPTQPVLPPPTKAPSGLGEGLFDDLDAAVDEQLSPAASGESAAPAKAEKQAAFAAADDPFAGFDLGAAPNPPAAAPAPVAAAPAAPADDSFGDLSLDMPLAAKAESLPAQDPAAAGAMAAGAGVHGEGLVLDTGDGDGDLDLDLPASPSAAPAEIGKPSADDPFAGIDLSPPPAAPTAPPAVPDDPFAGIDLDTAAPAPPPAAAASKPPADDLFGDMGDPFAADGEGSGPSGLETVDAAPAAAPSAPPASPAQPRSGSQDLDLFSADELGGATGAPDDRFGAATDSAAAADDDPFAAIDMGGPPAAAAGEDPGVGHDPFASLGGGGDVPDSATELEMGVGLDAEGKLVGEEKAAPTRGPRTQAPAEDRPAVVERPPGPPPMSTGALREEDPRRGAGLGGKLAFGLVLVVIAFFGFVIYRSGGKPDLTAWSTYVEAFTGSSAEALVDADLVALSLSSTSYANQDGHGLVVLWGKVKNSTAAAKQRVVITGQLLGPRNQVIKEMTVPVGVSFTPRQVWAMLDPTAVGDAYRAAYARLEKKDVPPGAEVPFMVVMFDHPPRMDDLRIRAVATADREPLAGLPAPAPPADENEEGDEGAEGAAAVKKPGPRPGPAAGKPIRAGAAGKKAVREEKRSGTFVKMKPGPAAP